MGLAYPAGKRPMFQRSEMMDWIASSSAGVTLPNRGVSVLATTATGASAIWTLQVPRKGYRKTIITESLGASTCVFHVNSPTSDTGFITSTQDMIELVNVGDSVVLIGKSTAMWYLESQTTGVSYSSST